MFLGKHINACFIRMMNVILGWFDLPLSDVRLFDCKAFLSFLSDMNNYKSLVSNLFPFSSSKPFFFFSFLKTRFIRFENQNKSFNFYDTTFTTLVCKLSENWKVFPAFSGSGRDLIKKKNKKVYKQLLCVWFSIYIGTWELKKVNKFFELSKL